jgi:hypothetical protein
MTDNLNNERAAWPQQNQYEPNPWGSLLDEAFQRFEGRITEGHRESRKFSRRHPQGISGGLKA